MIEKASGLVRGYKVSDLENLGPRRSWWYEQIALGNLEARKLGKRTIVLEPDLRGVPRRLAGSPLQLRPQGGCGI